MAYAITGVPGSGIVTAYTLAAEETLRVETVTWQTVADSSGNGHFGFVQLVAQNGVQVALIPDWVDVADAFTVTYTFGIGLRPFCATATDGFAIQNDLPDTVLESGCSVVVGSMDANGVTVAGDALSGIVLWVESVATGFPDQLPILTPVYQPPGTKVAA